jgi:hypothetical protein
LSLAIKKKSKKFGRESKGDLKPKRAKQIGVQRRRREIGI